MASVVDICNKALSLLGQKTIVSLDDNSPEAYACKIHWPGLRDEVFRSHLWNCATKRSSLNRLLIAPAFGHKYAYQLPVDYLYSEELEGNPYFKIEGRLVLTDAESVNLIYVYSLDDSTSYDALLAAALSYLLAGELAYQMTSSTSLAEGFHAKGQDKLHYAKSTDSMEGKRPDRRHRKWLSAKYG